MNSKSLRGIVQTMKSSRVRYAVIFASLVLILVFSAVQASGPMRPPHPPMPPQNDCMWGMQMPSWGMEKPMPPWGKPMPSWGMPRCHPWYPGPWYPPQPVPKIKIVGVIEDFIVFFETENFPENENFMVTMGEMYTRGIDGIEIGVFNSGDGSPQFIGAFIPPELYGLDRIAIRAQTDQDHPYYAFNWFYNTTAVAPEYTALEGVTAEDAEAQIQGSEGLIELDSLEAPLTEAAPVAEAPATEAPATEAPATEAPAAEETADEEESEEGVGGAADLTSSTWQWTGFSDPVQGDVTIDAPEQYTVTFLPEGLIGVKADCNNGNGTYITDEEGGIDIAIGIVTAAACAPESLSDQFLQYLGEAAVYSFDEDGNLILDLAADSGTMVFTAGGAVAPAEEAAEETAGSIVDIAVADGNFETLVAAVTAAGLADTLAGDGDLTVFAPTDDAFAALPEGTVESLLEDPEGALTDILLYHVVEGVVPAEVVVTLDSATTLLGEPVAISVVDGGVVLNDAVNVLITDVMADNGIIHVIDGVLLPPSISEAPAADGAEAETTEEEAEEPAESEEAATVTGTVTYLQRIALPDDAVVKVQIYNASLADATEVLGEQVIETNGQQIPIPYEVPFNPDDINENLMYSVSARIEDSAENLLFISDTVTLVITQGNPTEDVEIMTVQVQASPGAEEPTEEEAATEEASLAGVVWNWTEFADPVQGSLAIEDPSLYTVEFMEDGTVGIKADCNNGSGSYVADEAGAIDITVGAVTLALCAEDSLSDQFIQYLDAAAIYFFENGDMLLDLPVDSGTLRFVAAADAEAGATAKLASIAMMPVAGGGGEDEEEEESSVPSFTICIVERDETVSIVGENFPAEQTFAVKMGVAQTYMPMYKHPMPPKPMPYHGPMKPDEGMAMGMGMPHMGKPMGHPGGMWKKPAPKVWIPYYEAGSLETGAGGDVKGTFEIPAELAGAYKISILMRTDHQFPYISYNWFYNNDADVCNGEVPNT